MANEFIARNGLIAKDSSEITGSLKVTAGVTGSLLGTASFATTASFLIGGAGATITVADEGTSQGTATFLNFTGNAVTATVASNTASLTISTGSTVSTIAGTTNEILVNNGTTAVAGAITLSLPSTVNLGADSSFTSTGLTGSLTASSLQGLITNAQLQNSSVTVGTTAISLGGSATTIVGIASLTATNVTSSIISASNFISGGQIIARTGFTGSLTASSLIGDIILGTQTSGQYASTITGGSGLTATSANPNDGTAYTIDAVAGAAISLTSPTNDAINVVAGSGISTSAPTSSAVNLDTGSAHFTGGVTNRLNTLNVLSGSVSSPSQGTISVGGFTNIDLGLQTGDDVTFNRVTATNGLTGSITASSLQGLINNNQLRNSTISGVSLGGNLANLTQGTGVTAFTYNGSATATVAIGQDVGTTANVTFGSVTGTNGLTGSLTASSLRGAITNTQLQNSSVTVGSTNIALGGTSTTLAGLSSVSSTSLTGSITASSLQGAILNTQLQNSSVTVGTTAISLGGTQTTIAGLVSLTSTGLTGSLTASSLQGLINNNQLRNSTISGVSLGGTLPNLTQGTGVTAFTYNGSAAATVAIGQDVGTTANVTFGSVTATNGLTGSLTASSLQGDIRLGAQTSGQYASTITGGSGLTATAANANDSTAYTIDVVAGAGISLTAPTNDAVNIDTGSTHFTNGAKSTVYAGVSGDITINSSGVATIAANSVVLGTDTTGQYASTITGGAGLTATTAGGDDATAYTIDVNAGAGISLTAPTTDAVNIDTGSTHFTGGVKNKINTDGVVSASLLTSAVAQGVVSLVTNGVAAQTNILDLQTTSRPTFAGVTATTGFTGSITASSLQGLINNNQLRNSTISGVSLGGTLAALTNGSGISSAGTYDGSAARTFALDINGLTAESAIVDGDTFPFYDASVTANRKATADNIRDYVVSGISGDLTITNAGVATVSRATTVNVTSDSSNNNQPLIFAGAGTAIGLLNNTELNYNPSTKLLRLTGSILVSGNISATGEVTAYGTTSDIRYKKNITPISNSTEKVTNISGVHFEWIENSDVHPHSGKDVGVIAQDIEKVLPEAVTTRENGVKMVKYEKIIPLLIESIKDLQGEIIELKNKVKNLEKSS